MSRLIQLRPYQSEPLRAILRSIRGGQGLTFTLLMSRQAGKNELSAQLELLLLTLAAGSGGTIVKAAPTFRPQILNSIERLTRRLDEAGLGGHWQTEHGYQIRLGAARALFFSAAPASRVVGHTASRLLEIDEAQDVDAEKYARDFRPMGATANVTTVLYGTPWDESTLLAQTIATNRQQEARDGIRRHFAYDWRTVAAANPAYGRFVAAEEARLGAHHPIFRTQYALETLAGETGLFSPGQQAQLIGDHERRHGPRAGQVYLAGLDLAGEAGLTDPLGLVEPDEAGRRRAAGLHTPDRDTGDGRDSSVLTIAELDFSACDEIIRDPVLRIIDHVQTTGDRHAAVYARLIALVRHWGLRRLVVDATGLGGPIASFLRDRLGGLVEPFVFTAASKSRLAFDLIAAVNAGRVKVYRPDGSPEARQFAHQIAKARAVPRSHQGLDIFVDRRDGHDDFLISLALAVHAAGGYRPRVARGRRRDA